MFRSVIANCRESDMTPSILLLTQENIGSALLRAVMSIYDPLPLTIIAVSVNSEASAEVFAGTVNKRLGKIDNGAGLLVLADIPGGAAEALIRAANYQGQLRLVTGVNLPMLIELCKQAQPTLDELTAIAIRSGRLGILDSTQSRDGPAHLHAHQ